MQRLIIDCTTGKQTYEGMTPDEEATRLAESEANRIAEEARVRTEAKRQLIRELAELREMRQNRDIYTDEDIDARQTKIDELRGQLSQSI